MLDAIKSSFIFTDATDDTTNKILTKNKRIQAKAELEKSTAFIVVTLNEREGSLCISASTNEVNNMVITLLKALEDARRIAPKT